MCSNCSGDYEHPETADGVYIGVNDRVRIVQPRREGAPDVFEARVVEVEDKEDHYSFTYIPVFAGSADWDYTRCQWGTCRMYKPYAPSIPMYAPQVEVIGVVVPRSQYFWSPRPGDKGYDILH
jgi:hypothetical protein